MAKANKITTEELKKLIQQCTTLGKQMVEQSIIDEIEIDSEMKRQDGLPKRLTFLANKTATSEQREAVKLVLLQTIEAVRALEKSEESIGTVCLQGAITGAIDAQADAILKALNVKYELPTIDISQLVSLLEKEDQAVSMEEDVVAIEVPVSANEEDCIPMPNEASVLNDKDLTYAKKTANQQKKSAKKSVGCVAAAS